ncbi:MAG: hypothetical protein H6670_07455 [Anaerolineaceae bacterium]|nr:hypothetical protein [Anaerolineaceae bacterium]
MKWPARLLAVAIALWAVLFFLLAAIDLAVSQAIFNTDTYRAALSRDQVYQELVPNLLTVIVSETRANPTQGLPFNVSGLSERISGEEWHTITADLIPPEWIGQQIDLVISVIDGVTTGRFGIVDQPIDLVPLKRNLTGTANETAVEQLFLALPACTADEIDTIQQHLNGSDVQMPLCQPPEALYSPMSERISGWLRAIGTGLPDSVTLKALDIEATELQGLNLLVKLNQQGIALLFVCPIALLSLIVLLVVGSLRSFGRWTGGIIMVSGLLVLLSLLMLQAATLNSLAANWQLSGTENRFMVQIFLALVRSGFLNSSTTLLLIAAVFFGIGFVLLLLSIYAPSQHDSTSAEA